MFTKVLLNEYMALWEREKKLYNPHLKDKKIGQRSEGTGPKSQARNGHGKTRTKSCDPYSCCLCLARLCTSQISVHLTKNQWYMRRGGEGTKIQPCRATDPAWNHSRGQSQLQNHSPTLPSAQSCFCHFLHRCWTWGHHSVNVQLADLLWARFLGDPNYDRLLLDKGSPTDNLKGCL